MWRYRSTPCFAVLTRGYPHKTPTTKYLSKFVNIDAVALKKFDAVAQKIQKFFTFAINKNDNSQKSLPASLPAN